jgi:GT2 family glycosyltransferase
MIELSIIIINYNGEGYINACFDSIYNQCKGFSFEIIVVDNNSSDGSVSIIEKEYSNIRLIKNKENKGFASANNTAVAQAKGDYILLLNNDTLLVESIKPAIDLFDSNQEIGIVGIKMLNGNNIFTSSAGKFPNFLNFLKLKTILFSAQELGKKESLTKGEYFDIDWVSGSFLLTTKDIWNKVEGLDESYFMYAEDIDFNKKVSLLGKRRIFMSSIQYIHYVGFNTSREALLLKSFKKYIEKHYKGFGLYASLVMLNINYLYKKIKKLV